MKYFNDNDVDALAASMKELVEYTNKHTKNNDLHYIEDPAVTGINYIDGTRNFLKVNVICRLHRKYINPNDFTKSCIRYLAYFHCEDFDSPSDFVERATDDFAQWLDLKAM